MPDADDSADGNTDAGENDSTFFTERRMELKKYYGNGVVSSIIGVLLLVILTGIIHISLTVPPSLPVENELLSFILFLLQLLGAGIGLISIMLFPALYITGIANFKMGVGRHGFSEMPFGSERSIFLLLIIVCSIGFTLTAWITQTLYTDIENQGLGFIPLLFILAIYLLGVWNLAKLWNALRNGETIRSSKDRRKNS